MTILIFIIGLSLLIFIHELGHFLAAKFFGLWVEEFGFGFPPKLVSKKIGETVYSLNLLPFGGFVRIHGEKMEENNAVPKERSFWFLSVGRRALIIAAGVIMNFILGWVIISGVFMVGAPNGVIVTTIAENSPAEIAGILSGDKIKGFESVNDFIGFINGAKGREVAIEIVRGSENLEIKVVPRVNPPKGEGALGVALSEVGFPKLGFFKSLSEGFITSIKILGSIFVSLGGLISGIFRGGANLEGFVGPVGIFGIANQAAGFGLAYLLQLIGLISLNLVVLNILPIPALDGGRLFFLLIEKIKGSPISEKRQIITNAIGFGLLILLMVFITVRDVVKLF